MTHIRVNLDAKEGPANVRLSSASFFHKHEVASFRVEGPTTKELPVGRGAFDSGINEVFVETDAPITFISLTWIDNGKRDTSVHVSDGGSRSR